MATIKRGSTATGKVVWGPSQPISLSSLPTKPTTPPVEPPELPRPPKVTITSYQPTFGTSPLSVEAVDVVARGRPLRSHPSLKAGANVNFVCEAAGGEFQYRTYERGVEAETLACGTGAVAVAVLLTNWGLARNPIRLRTRSGRDLSVRLSGPKGRETPSLSGEARLVYRGAFGELPGA